MEKLPAIIENLPALRQSAGIAVYEPKPGTKAIDVRRQVILLPEVSKALTQVEKYVLEASTKTQIAELDDKVFAEKAAQILRFVAMDVGYNIPQNANDWGYIQIRLLDIIKRYYSQLTLTDLKLAFELATTGELDDYLPKDSKGKPDKNHYQNFNADYFAKILNAYKRKQSEVVEKAYNAVPKPEKKISPDEIRFYENIRKQTNQRIFLRYKYRGELIFGAVDEMLVYNWLLSVGLANPVAETEQDRKQALTRFLDKAARNMINPYKVYDVRQKGIDSPEIDFTAHEIARRREIIKTFDYMIENEIYVNSYLDL